MNCSQLQVLFLLTVQSFSIFATKKYNQCDFDIDHLVMPMCRVVFCVVGKRVFSITNVFFWQNSVSLCPASFCTTRSNLFVILGTLAFLLLHPYFLWEKVIFWCQFQKVFIEPMNFSFFSISRWHTDLDYDEFEWFALEIN